MYLAYLQAHGLWVGNQNKPFSMYKPSTYLAIIFMLILIPI
jgi:hypothetical protein